MLAKKSYKKQKGGNGARKTKQGDDDDFLEAAFREATAERAARKRANMIDGIAIVGFLVFVGMIIGLFASII